MCTTRPRFRWLRPGRLIALAAIMLLVIGLVRLRPGEEARQAMAWRLLARKAIETVEKRVESDRPVRLTWAGVRPGPLETLLEARFARCSGASPDAVPVEIHAWPPSSSGVKLRVMVGPEDTVALEQPVRSAVSILPTLAAITAALLLRRTLLPLLLGVSLGALLLEHFHPWSAVDRVARVYFLGSLTEQFYFSLIVFILGLIGMVGIGIRSGGVRGLVDTLLQRTRSRRGIRVLAPVLGLLIFFDDYSNTVVIGNALRPITDRLRISREKLAYVVDSTAAPVAGLMLFSTWIWYEVSQIQAPLMSLGAIASPDEAYDVFLMAIPFRFYCLFTLTFVLLNGLLGRDFGSMRIAEQRAATTGAVIRPGARPLLGRSFAALREKPDVPCRWWNIVVPLGVTMVAIGAGLVVFRESGQAMGGPSITGIVLAGSAMLGAILAGALAVGQRLLNIRETVAAFFSGLRAAGLAICILFLAWAIGGVCRDLGTAEYLGAALERDLAPAFLPVVLFLLAALISFSIGSSFSTMGILLPIAVPLTYTLSESAGLVPMPLTVVAIASVLDGAIFGDHCSPISDTTVLSSIASGSDHLDHVRTQLPYALTTMVLAVMAGYVPVLLGSPPAIALVTGGIACVLILLVFGRKATYPPET
jgi:Na+/H+ antiporter NhaC